MTAADAVDPGEGTCPPGGGTLKPPQIYMSLSRSVILRLPRSSMVPMSPVCRKPSASMVAAVASGSSRQPTITMSPRASTSPCSDNAISMPANARPQVLATVTASSSAGQVETNPEHSVSPYAVMTVSTPSSAAIRSMMTTG